MEETPNIQNNQNAQNSAANITGLFQKIFDQVVDPETKTFIEKISSSSNLKDKMDYIHEFGEKMKNDKPYFTIFEGNESNTERIPERIPQRNTENGENIDVLVQEERFLNERISKLNPNEQKEFYAKLYQIPTERDVHLKLDAILEKMDDLQTEISIIRKHLYSNQTF